MRMLLLSVVLVFGVAALVTARPIPGRMDVLSVRVVPSTFHQGEDVMLWALVSHTSTSYMSCDVLFEQRRLDGTHVRWIGPYPAVRPADDTVHMNVSIPAHWSVSPFYTEEAGDFVISGATWGTGNCQNVANPVGASITIQP